MPRKEKEVGSNHIGPSGPRGHGARVSWPSSGPRLGSPRPRRAFCKIAPSLPEYYAAPPSTIAPEKPFVESTPNKPIFATSRSSTPPRARRRGSGRRSVPSLVIRAKHPPYEQAYEHRGAKTKPRAVI